MAFVPVSSVSPVCFVQVILLPVSALVMLSVYCPSIVSSVMLFVPFVMLMFCCVVV